MRSPYSVLTPWHCDRAHDRVCLKGYVMLGRAFSSLALEIVGSPVAGWAVCTGILATSWYRRLRLGISFARVNSAVQTR